MASAAMLAVQTVSGNQPRTVQINEFTGQTYKAGTPVMLDSATGSVKAWTGSAYPGIIGIVRTFGQSLVSVGVAAPLHYGSVQNQSAALNIPVGQPLAYGKAMVETCSLDSVFYGEVGPLQSAGVANIGVAYGMSVDTDGHWYVDLTNTTAGQVVATIVALDQFDTPRGVRFQFVPANTVLLA